MLRGFLLFIGWGSMASSVFDGALFAFLVWLAAGGQADWMMTLDAHLKDHVPWLYWVRDVAEFVMPMAVVEWLFALPAIVYFPVRILMSIVIGGWALSAARRMKG